MSHGFFRPARGKFWSPLRGVTVFAVAAFAGLLGAPAADAHSVLISSTPAKGAAIAAAPAEVALVFNEPLERQFTELTVIGPDGVSHWEAGPVSIVDSKVSVPLGELGPAGGYTIRYRVTSADGHPVSGAIPFTLTVPGTGTARPAAAAAAASTAPAGAPMPWWPWAAGGLILLGIGFAVARRVARVEKVKS